MIRQNIFAEVYRHVGTWKAAGAIATRIGISREKIIKAIRPLVLRKVVLQDRRKDDIYYGMDGFIKAHRDDILRYAKSPKDLASLATKRRPLVQVKSVLKQSITYKQISIPSHSFEVKRITVDDIDMFSAIRAIPSAGNLIGMSEDAFKKGVQKIVNEMGEFKDWGGEKSDLFSTRLVVEGKRRAVAFAFKGPGLPGKLNIARMGKNGDQAPRLFQEPAEVFLVQHWREIDSQVLDLLQALAIAKSATTGKPVWYGIIDGQDSDRLVRAYPGKFK